jgi:hypothetical protein
MEALGVDFRLWELEESIDECQQTDSTNQIHNEVQKASEYEQKLNWFMFEVAMKKFQEGHIDKLNPARQIILSADGVLYRTVYCIMSSVMLHSPHRSPMN